MKKEQGQKESFAQSGQPLKQQKKEIAQRMKSIKKSIHKTRLRVKNEKNYKPGSMTYLGK